VIVGYVSLDGSSAKHLYLTGSSIRTNSSLLSVGGISRGIDTIKTDNENLVVNKHYVIESDNGIKTVNYQYVMALIVAALQSKA
jgi:hypothetical protein